MKHDKKHKKHKKSSKSSKKSKKDRKDKKQKYKEKKKRDKKIKDTVKVSNELSAEKTRETAQIPTADDVDDYCGPSIDLMNRAKCPETKAEYDHRQNQMKRVVDPETGRVRLIKGDGEILEEIVTRDRHKQINHDATRNDGRSFQKNTVGSMRR